VTSELQELAAEIMREHCPGIEPGHKKRDRLAVGADLADTIHRSVRQLHEDLPAEIAKKEAELAEMESRITAKKAELDGLRAGLDELRGRQEEAESRLASLDEREQKLKTRQEALDRGEQALRSQREEILALESNLKRERETLKQEQAAEQEAARKAREAVEIREQEAKAARKEFEDGLKAIASISQEAVQGTLRLVDGRLYLNDPTAVKAVSPRIRKQLVPMMNQLARAKVEIDGLRKKLRDGLGRVGEWLCRDDLTDEARRDGEDLLDDGMDGPG